MKAILRFHRQSLVALMVSFFTGSFEPNSNILRGIEFLSVHAEEAPTSVGSSKSNGLSITGNAEVLSNYMRYGLTHSDKGPAVKGFYLFGLGPQFRIGVSSASVYYQNESNYLDIEIIADIKIDFSSNVDARINYGSENYSKSNTRNGENYGLELRLFKYLITYKRLKNWEGTRYPSNHFSLSYPWEITTNFIWQIFLEYNQMTNPALVSYLDVGTGLQYQAKPMTFSIMGTYTSNASQYVGRAEPSLNFSIATDF